MRLYRRGRRDEEGLVLILITVVVTVMFAFTALVIDLAQLRTDRRVNKSVTDLSVRAGLAVLNLGPWSGVCRASAYLKANAPAFSDFDPGSEKWFQLGSPVNLLTSSPCLNINGAPFVNLCLPGEIGIPNTSTWGRLTATAAGGRFTIEIQSGYAMPDSRFPEDLVAATDTGDPFKGSCDNMVVIITERRAAEFAGVFGGGERITTVRSVGRISNLVNEEYSPALLLLERDGCNVLEVTGSGSRVVAQPYLTYPGVIQIDSANRGGCASNQAVLNAASASSLQSILICSARTLNPTPGCNVALGDKASRVGMYALNFEPPGAHTTTAFPETYGDTLAVRGARSGRDPLDRVYRENIVALDAEADGVINGNSGRPPGCASVTGNTCTALGRKWLVLQQTNCNSYTTFFATPDLINFPTGRLLAQNIWFNCSLNVNGLVPLLLPAVDSYVVVTEKLEVSSTLNIVDPRTVFVGGSDSGNKIGLDIGNGADFNLNNPVAGQPCVLLPLLAKATRMVVGKGAFTMGSGGTVHMCQTFAFLASGYGRVPESDGTVPCSSPCDDYLGKISVGSGAVVDWIAPNQIRGVRPTAEEILDTNRYEDMGLWTEAAGAQNINGGGTGNMTGVYFLGNADPFTLTGGSTGDVVLSAQFITRRMKVAGNSTVNLVLNPFDSVPVVTYEMALVR